MTMNSFPASSDLSSYVDAYPANRYTPPVSSTDHDYEEPIHGWNEDSSLSSGSGSYSSSDALLSPSSDEGSQTDLIEQIPTRTPRDAPRPADITPYPHPLAEREDPIISPHLFRTEYGEFNERTKRTIKGMLRDVKDNARSKLRAKFGRDGYESDEGYTQSWTLVHMPDSRAVTDHVLRGESRGRKSKRLSTTQQEYRC